MEIDFTEDLRRAYEQGVHDAMLHHSNRKQYPQPDFNKYLERLNNLPVIPKW